MKQIANITNLPMTTTHRILCSLVQGNELTVDRDRGYTRFTGSSAAANVIRVGYAAQTNENSFSRLVTESIQSSAFSSGIELVTVDNDYSVVNALRNADLFVREKVKVAIEFQSYEAAAPKVAAQLAHAGIPVIAIEIPHPGAIYFGANNYRAGYIGGSALARAAEQRWDTRFDEILLMKQSAAGQVPHARIDGTISALRRILPNFLQAKLIIIEGYGRFEKSVDAMRKHLRRSKARRFILSGINDLTCLGALQALREAGREQDSLIVGQNGTREARLEIRKEHSSFIGSVAYFPERYGEKVIALANEIVRGRQVPSASFTKHLLLSRTNIDRHYPYDENGESPTVGDGFLSLMR